MADKMSRVKEKLSFGFPITSDKPGCTATEDGKRLEMSLVVRKPVLGVSDKVRHKPGCTTTEDGWRIEISYLGSSLRDCTICAAKTMALISFTVTAKLICVSVFA